ncbi:mitochondrial large subunit ribosomal protein-domain-containing protein [Dendryphion nanum]|uniref:Large ribosomal subunit protein mL49 n=1 Tax=Dendryphion nanum TaxID=256645 RepID=A0A9P9J1P6_9PLEO|nr:mitochondrial large subunit ribosomal protein-domain-containing protein [Dendryphion nanum]
MPRIQPFLGFLKPAAAPRIAIYRPTAVRFSTAPRLYADEPTKPLEPSTIPAPTTASIPKAPQTSPSNPPSTPSSPEEASRAADLAAAEAVTESDSAQPSAPKPILPSEHTESAPPAAPALKTSSKSAPKRTSRTKTQNLKPKSNTLDPISTSQTLPPGKAKLLKLQAKATKALREQAKLHSEALASNPESTTQSALSLAPAKYHVGRTKSSNLPIYSDYKRGGNLHLTTVSKVSGNVAALRDELRTFLKKQDEDVVVNALTQHVVIKGHHVQEVGEFLKARGM